jgi:hypothetical protein|tara:strand:+ start:1243 stop:2166 length:924 start_codon:yes stop_codon:yes gene_type:complete
MALTLLQQAQFATSGEQLAIIQELAAGDLLSVLPFQSIEGNSIRFRREETLPSVGFRHINGTLDESYGEISMQSEALHLYGGDLRVDKAILQLEGSEAKAWNIQSRVRAMRMDFERAFIKGSEEASNGLEFDGLQARIGTSSSQYIANQSGNSGALSFGALDEALDEVDAQGGQKYLVMSKQMRRALTKGSRDNGVNGGVHISTDEIGRQRMMYADVPILIMDKDQTNTDILGATEANSTSSIYVATFGDLGCTGIQNGSINVRELGEDTSRPQLVTRIEWYCGLAVKSGRSVARLAKIDPTLAAIA